MLWPWKPAGNVSATAAEIYYRELQRWACWWNVDTATTWRDSDADEVSSLYWPEPWKCDRQLTTNINYAFHCTMYIFQHHLDLSKGLHMPNKKAGLFPGHRSNMGWMLFHLPPRTPWLIIILLSLSFLLALFTDQFRLRSISIRGLMRGITTLPQGNQEPLVVRDKVRRPQVSFKTMLHLCGSYGWFTLNLHFE